LRHWNLAQKLSKADIPPEALASLIDEEAKKQPTQIKNYQSHSKND